jgi:putative nucleotidyltransferase with HDIG domain
MTDVDKKGEELKAQRFQMLQDIASELTGDVTFPTSFDTAIRLREHLSDEDWSLDEVAVALNAEPLVASRLVGMANSAAYHTGGDEITDVRRAVMRLGMNLVRFTALTVATQQISGAISEPAFKAFSEKLWRHSLRTASSAYVISKHFSSYDPDEALLAGMVHDIGAFYMLYRASQYEELCERPKTVIHMIMQWHDSIGSTLLDTLGMPEKIVEAIREHDQPRVVSADMLSLKDIIYVANLMSGGAAEWRLMDNASGGEELDKLDARFTDLKEEILEHEKEFRSLLA